MSMNNADMIEQIRLLNEIVSKLHEVQGNILNCVAILDINQKHIAACVDATRKDADLGPYEHAPFINNYQ